MSFLPIIDNYGRVHNSLRIGVTDRCNIRCFYCMPEKVQFLPRAELLSFEEIKRLTVILARHGVDRIRITGGEPLVRSELWRLIEMIKSIDGIREVALTTNGLLLAQQVERLRSAGLDRLNVSLDTIDPAVFQRVTRRTGLEKVLAGIDAAQAIGMSNIRINAVSISGITESEIVPLAEFARRKNLELRFIEFMPLDGDQAWENGQVLSGAAVKSLIEANVGKLVRVERHNPGQPAVDYAYQDHDARVGFINSVTEPFCGDCNRMRVTAEGKFRNCLFSSAEWDIRSLLRSGASDEQIEGAIRQCIGAKKVGHGTDDGKFLRPEKAMYQIGG